MTQFSEKPEIRVHSDVLDRYLADILNRCCDIAEQPAIKELFQVEGQINTCPFIQVILCLLESEA